MNFLDSSGVVTGELFKWAHKCLIVSDLFIEKKENNIPGRDGLY